MLVLPRDMFSASAISCAEMGSSASTISAKIWPTVRLKPQRLPISPKCITAEVISGVIFISIPAELSEITESLCRSLIEINKYQMKIMLGGTRKRHKWAW